MVRKMKIKVVVGFVFKNEKLVLIKHKRKNMWLPVGGHVEEGETDKEALLREIKEELNIEVEVLQKPFFILEEPNETTSHFICLYKSGEVEINSDEIIDYKFFTKKEIIKSKLDEQVKSISLDAFKNFGR